MFDGYLTDSFFSLLVVVNVSVICLFLLSRVRRLQGQMREFQQATRVEVAKLASNVSTLHGRLRLAEQQLDKTNQKQDELKVNKSLDTNFSQASKLLNMGLDSDQLVHGFGLSEAEANLMSLVHTKQGREGRAA